MEISSSLNCSAQLENESSDESSCIPFRDENDNFVKSRVNLGNYYSRHSIIQLNLKIDKNSALALDNLKITDCSIEPDQSRDQISRSPGILRTNILTSTEAVTSHPASLSSTFATTTTSTTTLTNTTHLIPDTTTTTPSRAAPTANDESEFSSITELNRTDQAESEIGTEIEIDPTTTSITGQHIYH